MRKIKLFADKIKQHINESGAASSWNYIPLALLGMFNYVIFYFVWLYSPTKNYENITLRIIGFIICLILALKKFWPKALKKYVNFYWYFLLIYCFPFFFAFMLLKNSFSSGWVITSLWGLLFLAFLIDWLSMFVIVAIGSVMGFILYMLTTNQYNHPKISYIELITYLIEFLIIAFFARNREQYQKYKLETVKILGASIAHELRTPLAAIDSQAEGLKQNLPKLISSYEIAKNQNLEIPFLKKPQLEALDKSAEIIHKTTRAGFHVIDMLLMNVKQAPFAYKGEVFSMRSCIEKALREYPLQEAQKPLIHLDVDQDFKIKVNQELLIHVFFNLLRNALYYTAAVDREAGIFIRLENQPNYRVYFKDTGAGIEPKDLPRVFDRFFSRTYHGAGIGLTFCKLVVEYFSGKISVDSVKGEYTTFILTFPKNHGEHHAS